jgi:hypothetical protein
MGVPNTIHAAAQRAHNQHRPQSCVNRKLLTLSRC